MPQEEPLKAVPHADLRVDNPNENKTLERKVSQGKKRGRKVGWRKFGSSDKNSKKRNTITSF